MTAGEQETAGSVRRMFAEIAPRYDLLNHLLSFNIDRAWRKTLRRRLAPVLDQPEARVLDLCCGTGDVLFYLGEHGPAQVFGADFCHPMLVAADKKAMTRGQKARLIEADALDLPLGDSSIDAISIAFGFRNLANYHAGLSEFHRVLKPGGLLAILEFSHPTGRWTSAAYGFYSSFVLPTVGGLLSGSRAAYSYLPESIRRFPAANELRAMIESHCFVEADFELLSGGIAALHYASKASAPATCQPS